ncbi:hypothetical protein IAG41_00315 [Sphingomonas sp. JC676]|uniref:hypothetical protein n=1 Tax=Sphingomonas sp. JC676 TaxID=2768065 RepID=UPI001658409B|nr:hypothetical protein [Sphingomonas sp. JC676]MBC9030824.1 hypothetical protein [Sphingomonas sp. JC676]
MKLDFMALGNLSIDRTNMRHDRMPDVTDLLRTVRKRGILQILLARAVPSPGVRDRCASPLPRAVLSSQRAPGRWPSLASEVVTTRDQLFAIADRAYVAPPLEPVRAGELAGFLIGIFARRQVELLGHAIVADRGGREARYQRAHPVERAHFLFSILGRRPAPDSLGSIISTRCE